MIALALSGGANFGALQAGALETLLETGFRPRIITGTSAGALNAIFLASNPTVEGVKHLQELWRKVGPNEVGKLGVIMSIRRLTSSEESLLPSEPLAHFLLRSLPKVETFEELTQIAGIKAYVTGVCVEDAELRIFGDLPEDRLIDGCMASCAMAPFLPPWKVGEKHYLDGGVYIKLPIMTAIEHGATQVVALHITDFKVRLAQKGVLFSIQRSVSLMTRWMVETEIKMAKQLGVPVRVIPLGVPPGIALWDYSQADRLINLGRAIARKSLEEEPLKIYNPLELFLRRFDSKLKE
uniref:PNPLA domain-containing protein n=1 Tax=candidate division WWE3 bacterium TaxID=2053526 RepID=A0A831YYY7_UNCKA